MIPLKQTKAAAFYLMIFIFGFVGVSLADAKSKSSKVEVTWQSYSGPAGDLLKILAGKLSDEIIKKCGSFEKVLSIRKVSFFNEKGFAGQEGKFIGAKEKDPPELYLEYPILQASALVECAR